jgi:hypothetical protein
MRTPEWTTGMAFDRIYYVTLKEAVALVKSIRHRADTLTIRKFLVGVVHPEIAGDDRIDAYAERYQESVDRIDEPSLPMLKIGHPDDEVDTFIPEDFWRYSMAIEPEAEACFDVSNLGSEIEKRWDQLPYRFRKANDVDIPGMRCTLYQLAEGIHFPRQKLEAIVRDPAWQKWIAKPSAARKRGRIPEWKWDEVKATLTIEASRDPSLLTSGTGKIVEFMAGEFRTWHHNDHPDLSDLYAYADRCVIRPIPPEQHHAPGSPEL